MKCKICGHRTNTISAMAEHYRDKHPRKMIGVRARHLKVKKGAWGAMRKYCSCCGKEL